MIKIEKTNSHNMYPTNNISKPTNLQKTRTTKQKHNSPRSRTNPKLHITNIHVERNNRTCTTNI